MHWSTAVSYTHLDVYKRQSQLLPGGPSPANDAVGRFNQQARDWYGQMQQVAAQFAGQDSSPADVSQAWREAIGANALGGSGSNPFLDLFKQMRGPGAQGMDEWLEQVQPWLQGFQQQSQRWSQSVSYTHLDVYKRQP